jgi:hypothetical protein
VATGTHPERTLIEGKPALRIVARLAGMLEDEIGRLRRLSQRDIVSIERAPTHRVFVRPSANPTRTIQMRAASRGEARIDSKIFQAATQLCKFQLERTTDFGASLRLMSHGVHNLLNAFVSATVAFGSAVLFTVAVVGLGLLPVAVVLFAPLFLR